MARKSLPAGLDEGQELRNEKLSMWVVLDLCVCVCAWVIVIVFKTDKKMKSKEMFKNKKRSELFLVTGSDQASHNCPLSSAGHTFVLACNLIQIQRTEVQKYKKNIGIEASQKYKLLLTKLVCYKTQTCVVVNSLQLQKMHNKCSTHFNAKQQSIAGQCHSVPIFFSIWFNNQKQQPKKNSDFGTSWLV